MLIFKKEKHARKLALSHFAKTHESLHVAHDVLVKYLAGNLAEAQQLAKQVVALESEADALKHEIRDVLFSGAFLPNIRSDIYRLVDAVDSVADKGETASHFIVNQQPAIPGEFHSELTSVFGLCLSCYNELREGLKSFFKPKGEMQSLREYASLVGDLETEVDSIEAELTRSIFNSSMDLAQKVHLCQLLKYIARIADSTEDAADELQFAAMKAVI